MSLDDRTQSLPQELQDLILEAAFMSFSSDTIVCVTRGYTTPAALQINRATRARAAAIYYSSQIFNCSISPAGQSSRSWLRWLASVDAPHLPHLSHVRVRVDGTCNCRETRCSLRAFAHLGFELRHHELKVELDVFRLKLRHGDPLQKLG